MSLADARFEGIGAYARARRAELDSGKTLLVLFVADRAVLALAAGLPRALDRERLLTVARYLVRRESADRYWLVAPMAQDGLPCLLLEAGSASGFRHSVLSLPDAFDRVQPSPARDLSGVEPLLGNLFASDDGLPGILRRQLDRLAEASAVPLPEPNFVP